jgi:hypothetical protein
LDECSGFVVYFKAVLSSSNHVKQAKYSVCHQRNSVCNLTSLHPNSHEPLEPGLSQMIWAAVAVARPDVQVTQVKTVWLFITLLFIHGVLNSVRTKHLAWVTSSFLFINIGTAFGKKIALAAVFKGEFVDISLPVIIIVLLAMTGRENMHSADYVFGKAGIINQTNGWSTGLSFLFGLLSVQWTVSTRQRSICPYSCFLR